MASRHEDWLRQAKKDLGHARHSLDASDFEWACFAAQQAAEKATEALIESRGGEARGHSVAFFLRRLPPDLDVADDLVSAAKHLDKHYIPTRYPNGFDQGAPLDYYTEEEAATATRDAERLVLFCESHLHRA